MKRSVPARGSVTQGPVGVIVRPRRGTKHQVVAARVKALATQLRKAGLHDVVCLSPGWGRAAGNGAVRSISPRGLERYVSGRPALFVSQDQYHLPHEWASDLLDRAVASDRCHHPDGIHESLMLSHLRIYSTFIAAPASASRQIAAQLRAGQLNLSTPAESLEAIGLPAQRIEVTPKNTTLRGDLD